MTSTQQNLTQKQNTSDEKFFPGDLTLAYGGAASNSIQLQVVVHSTGARASKYDSTSTIVKKEVVVMADLVNDGKDIPYSLIEKYYESELADERHLSRRFEQIR